MRRSFGIKSLEKFSISGVILWRFSNQHNKEVRKELSTFKGRAVFKPKIFPFPQKIFQLDRNCPGNSNSRS